ncbi:B9 domain-containing protein 2-like [Homarus americanus]|uniref:B9 domain-containing protein 2-like n=1 Tax=Homarus americanus TaxID=6706 RepID=A0A8J5JWF7_HOMAM|nr:B9 domain-containing protein 2-like [Homarus americanus]
MAEVHIIGQVTGASGFPKASLFCKWILQFGGGWKVVEGLVEGQTQADQSEVDDTVCWCHPVDIHLATRGIQEWPKFLIQVYRQDDVGRIDLCGYGIIHVPTKPGHHKMTCHTWRPVGTFAEELRRTFLGGGPQLLSTEFMHSARERTPENMLLKYLYLGLTFTLLHVKPFSGENHNDKNLDREATTQAPDLVLPKSEVQVNLNDDLSEETLNTESNETLIIPSNSTQNETDIDYELSDNNTLIEVETTTLHTTEVPTSPSPVYDSELIVGDFCLCNLKVGFCDINCCCDEDCSADDRRVFSHCQMRPQDVLDSRYCFQKQIIFSNHTEYKVEYMQNGVLCIVTDNMPQRTTYTTVKGATTIEEYKQLKRNERHFPWESTNQVVEFEVAPYTAGSLIWAVNEEGYLFNIGIPDSVIGNECETMESLHFLEDTRSSCNRVFHYVSEECETNMIFNAINFLSFFVVADPSTFNKNSSTVSPSEPIETTSSVPPTSTALTDTLEKNTTELPNLDETMNYTAKEQTSAKLIKTNEQNGNRLRNFDELNVKIPVPPDFGNLFEDQLLPVKVFLCQGITDVQAKVYFTNVTDVMTHFTNNFGVEYIWASSEHDVIFKRSGHPGYIIGKPILLGKLVTNVTEEGDLKEAIYLDTDPRQWLTMLAPGREGRCDSRSQVTFGEEMRTGCIIQLKQEDFSDCQLLQHQFLKLLLGHIRSNTNELRIATFGHELGVSKCFDLILSLHFEIAFSQQGSLANPQAKVIGIVLHYGEPQSIEFTCGSLGCQNALLQDQTPLVELVSSVSFVEVTQAPQPAYSQPPTLDVKLPYDFFYPFLPSSSSVPLLHGKFILVWNTLLLVVLTLWRTY